MAKSESDFPPNEMVGTRVYPKNISILPHAQWLRVEFMRKRTSHFPNSYELYLTAKDGSTYLVWATQPMIGLIKRYDHEKGQQKIYIKYFGLKIGSRSTEHQFDILTTNQSNGVHIPQEPPRRQLIQPTNNYKQPPNLKDEVSTSNTMAQDPAPAVPDRPRRAVSHRLCYDAHTGKYAPCDSGDCIDA